MGATMCGYYFEREIRAGGKAFNIHIRKVPITQYTSFKEDGIYDYFAVCNGVPVAIECKATKTEASFPFDSVEEHQLLALLEMHDSGGKAYVLINVRLGRAQCAYILPVKEFVKLKEYYAAAGRKSIPVKALKNLPKLTRLNKPAGWDIRCLFTEETYNEKVADNIVTDSASIASTESSKTNNRKKSKTKDV